MAVPAVADSGAASMDDSMETEWLHRIDVEEGATREDGVRVDFRSAELSKVNDDGEGSSSRGCKGQDLGMPQAYAQCKASRESELKKRAIETSAVPKFGCEGGEGLKPLGSFSAHPEGLKTCFVGSRVQKGGKLSNQNLATSFDPASLKCIAYPTEHDILDKNKPFCVCVADQCFISNLAGGGVDTCIAVVRIEGGKLEELADMIIEIFEGCNFPPGSIILLGSGTHLLAGGATLYAMAWGESVAKLESKLENIQVGPLITLPRENLTGELGQSYVALTYWYRKMYENKILGLHDVWARFAGYVTQITNGSTTSCTYCTIALPESLSITANLVPTRFMSSNSRLIETSGFDLKTTKELVRMLLMVLSRDFGIRCSPENSLLREPEAPGHTKEGINSLMLVGASNMRRLASHLSGNGFKTENISMEGGFPTETAVKKLKEDLASVTEGTAIVYDLLGNFTYRFVQADGSLALPVVLGGKYHLLGDLDLVGEGTFKGVVNKLLEIFAAKKRIQYKLFCHPSQGISAGRVAKIFSTQATAGIPKWCRHSAPNWAPCANCWIPDVLEGLYGSKEGEGRDPAEVGGAAGGLFCKDNVHLSQLGFEKLAQQILCGIDKSVAKKDAAAVLSVSGSERFYWRGFCSVRGSTRVPKQWAPGSAVAARGRGGSGAQRGFHPYARGSGHRGSGARGRMWGGGGGWGGRRR